MAVGGVSDVDKSGGGTPDSRSDRTGRGGDRDPKEKERQADPQAKLKADVKAKVDAGFTDDEIMASLVGSGVGTQELAGIISEVRGSASAAARATRIASSSKTGTSQSILGGSGPAPVERPILGGGI